MIILSVHNKYLIRGGEDESRDMEESLLEKHGHTVIRYEIDNLTINEISKINLSLKTIWSQKSYNDTLKILKENNVDIVHVQNSFPQVSPSVYFAAEKMNIPVVQSVRNYRIICPNALLYRDNKICEECISKKIPFPSIIHKCYRNSYSATFLTTLMLTVHNYLNTWNEKVSLYVAVSQFVKDKMIEGGIDESKIVVKPNFVLDEVLFNSISKDYFIFVGRLSDEKGIKTLCKAWRNVGKIKELKIIGVGDGKQEVLNLINDGFNVTLTDRMPLKQVLVELSNARAAIVPSEWYEPFGRVIIEAYSVGTPVIANNIGGMKELIDDGKTGFLTIPQSVSSLTEKILLMANHKEYFFLRRNARRKFELNYTPKINYQLIEQIYKRLISK